MRQPKHSHAAKAERQARFQQLSQAIAAPTPANRLVGVSAFVRAHIQSGLLAEEPALAETCWIEYAYMTPLDRTELFTRAYVEVFRMKWEQYVDYATASEKCPAEEEFSLNTREEMTALWKARQTADAIGAPYLTYLLQVFEHAATIEGHTKLLRPNQLYSDPQVKHLITYWDERHASASLAGADWDDRFRAENYTGDAAQTRFHDLIQDRVKDEIGLANYVIRQPAMPEAVARQRFGDAMVDDAIRWFGSGVPALPVASIRVAYMRPCLGLAYTKTPACTDCALAELCGAVTCKTDAHLQIEYGSSEPLADRKRKGDRDRQQRHRMRKRNAENSRLDVAASEG
jgi:hypothetical protein